MPDPSAVNVDPVFDSQQSHVVLPAIPVANDTPALPAPCPALPSSAPALPSSVPALPCPTSSLILFSFILLF